MNVAHNSIFIDYYGVTNIINVTCDIQNKFPFVNYTTFAINDIQVETNYIQEDDMYAQNFN